MFFNFTRHLEKHKAIRIYLITGWRNICTLEVKIGSLRHYPVLETRANGSALGTRHRGCQEKQAHSGPRWEGQDVHSTLLGHSSSPVFWMFLTQIQTHHAFCSEQSAPQYWKVGDEVQAPYFRDINQFVILVALKAFTDFKRWVQRKTRTRGVKHH